MVRQYVDRGDPLEGINQTLRDHRLPYNAVRSSKNFTTPDGRARKRGGFKETSDKPIVDNLLAKQTGTGRVTDQTPTQGEESRSDSRFVTPMSYGLLKWHDDWQPKASRDFTLEFNLWLGDHEELVDVPFKRAMKGDFVKKTHGGGTSAQALDFQLRKEGVFILDMTCLSSVHQFSTGTVASTGHQIILDRNNAANTPTNTDPLPLTTMAITHDADTLDVTMGLINKSAYDAGTNTDGETYFPNAIVLSHALHDGSAPYVPGTKLHVAVTYATADRTIRLWINGVAATGTPTYQIPAGGKYDFIGAWDSINGFNSSSVQVERDIVLLNECTVRGGYASVCRVTEEKQACQIFGQSYDASVADPARTAPWCCSPPRGTAIKDLRIWHAARTGGGAGYQLYDNKDKSIGTPTEITEAVSGNLKGSWPLNDGGGVCYNGVADDGRDITLHHGYPNYVSDSALLHELGMRFADGQHLILSTDKDDDLFVTDIQPNLENVFKWDQEASFIPSKTNDAYLSGRHDFSTQIQIRTPARFQQEINVANSGPTTGTATSFGTWAAPAVKTLTSINPDTGGSAEQRAALGGSNGDFRYALVDGKEVNFGSETQLLDHNGVNPSSTFRFNRAFDQTLFSIEGRRLPNDSDNYGERWRIPLARGLLTPAGYVAFEVTLDGDSDTPRQYRMVTTAALDVNTVYTLTFVKRSLLVDTTGSTKPDQLSFEIWVQKAGQTALTVPTASFKTIDAWTGGKPKIRSYSCKHESSYDVIIGASYVNDGWDKWSSSYTPNSPWQVSQHFMSPYYDQPGFFTLGYFRLWATAVGKVEATAGASTRSVASIAKSDYVASLIFNLELQYMSGLQIPNSCRYPVTFNLGYKSWGEPQNYKNLGYKGRDNNPVKYLPGSFTTSLWDSEDCLGYVHLLGEAAGTAQYDTGAEAECSCLALFQTTITQSYGLIQGFKDHLSIDQELNGGVEPLYIQSHGLLNDFAAGEDWTGTAIGDRTILTSFGGIPKVYNGKNLLPAGLKKWSGGSPIVKGVKYDSAVTLVDQEVEAGLWYGVGVVYFSEEYGLIHVSPRSVVLVPEEDADNKKGTIRLYSIPAHPDPRITGYSIYRTIGQETASLAKATPLFPATSMYANKFSVEQWLTKQTPYPGPLDENITPLPVCAHAAAINNRLYLAGDVLVGDTIYFSDPGNPEKFDTVANRLVIEEASGDKINGLASMYGTLFAFKSNSLWRIEEVNVGQHQVQKIASVGAVSKNSIVLLNMPDTGRTVIAFWSQHGPYLFDGASLQYIGFPIEEKDNPGVPNAEYTWLDPQSVTASHDIRNREVIFYYKLTAAAERHTEAVVYNYRFNAWYRYTEVLGKIGLSTTFTGSDIGDGSFGFGRLPGLGFTSEFHAYVGATNGKVYKWAESEDDGLPGSDSATEYEVNGSTATSSTADCTVTIQGTILGNNAYKHLWATVRDAATGEWYSRPVASNTTTTVVLDASLSGLAFDARPFEPRPGDTLYLCRAPASMEFPWDLMDIPFKDKEVIDLMTWHNGNFYMRMSKDWDDTKEVVPFTTKLNDADAGRNRTEVLKAAEAFKLKLVSFDKGATLDSYAYNVDFTDDGIDVQ